MLEFLTLLSWGCLIFGGLPCIFTIVMVACGVSKKKLGLLIGLPGAVLIITSFILSQTVDRGTETFSLSGGIFMLSFGVFCPPLVLIGLLALYQELRAKSRQGKGGGGRG